ncbi:MAG TPA: M13 family metallopeptidase [Clostridia bacterium]|nr:M13 family metallopeptidase [Clostridia bacterium]
MRAWKSLAVVLLASAAAVAQTAPVAPVTQAPVSFDKAAMDTTVNPCEDFYQYACGTWRKTHPIPADKSRYGRFDELLEYNVNVLHEILEEVSKKKDRNELEQKVGDFYSACMDEKTVDALGAKPLQAEFDRIGKITNKQQLLDVMAHLRTRGIPTGFNFAVGPDLHDATMNIADVDQGGISLGDRDYYISDKGKHPETRSKYLEHVQKMFELLGEKPEQAAADAKAVMGVETKFAEAYMDRVARRDPRNHDHKMKTAELAQLAPAIDFQAYFNTVGIAKFDQVNVSNPEYIKKFNGYIDSISIQDWKTYLRWKVLRASAMLLSKPFVEESFRFNGQYLSGQKELEARWKRCSRLTDQNLGEALGPLYVAKAFPPDAKKRMDVLVKAVSKSMGDDIQTLEWMSAETKKAADAKLAKFTQKIGYPEKWKDYSSVKITGNALVENVRNSAAFEVRRNYNKVNKPVDKKEWSMTPPTVNAYYSSSHNNINFPAGILQPPFFSNSIDDSVNYGAIGVVIGHEITHGFDDQGRKFDGDGNLRDWWGPKDGPEFEKRAECIANQYGNFVAVSDPAGDVKLNGKLTLGENTADNGGLKIAYMALMEQLGADAEKPIDGFTPAQRFFIGFAQVWCENVTDQRARELALIDPHSPGKYRTIGTVQNSPEFRTAFNCKPGQPMAPEDVCKVW